MKSVFLGILLIAMLTDPMKITRINQTKREARTAFNSGDFKTAIAKYKYLSDSLGVKEDELMLNLAHAYFQTKDTTNAYPIYQQLSASTLNTVRSKAQLQLGIMHHQQNKLEEALNNFKQAIKADATNMDARYNYEMLKKKLDEKKKQEEQKKKDQQNKDQQKQDQDKDQQKQDQQNKDQQNKDQQKKDQQQKQDQKQDQEQKEQEKKEQQEQEQKNQEQKKKEEKEKQQNQQQQEQKNQKEQKKELPQDVRDRLEQMKMDPQKAKMILDAMKNKEEQYLQQNKRKATKSKDKTKPDW